MGQGADISEEGKYRLGEGCILGGDEFDSGSTRGVFGGFTDPARKLIGLLELFGC